MQKNHMKKHIIRLTAMMLCAAVLFPSGDLLSFAAGENNSQNTVSLDSSGNTYFSYLKKYKDKQDAESKIEIAAHSYLLADASAKVLAELDGRKNILTTGEDGFVEWEFEVEKEGFYQVGVDYYPVKGKGAGIVRNVKIDGAVPYQESQGIAFSRAWGNETAITKDQNGNELRPAQVEKPQWLYTLLKDPNGYSTTPLKFYLSAGKHRITLESVKEPMAIDKLTLSGEEQIPTYSEKQQEYQQKGYQEVKANPIKIQGEQAVLKSDSMIYPLSDRSSSATEFTDPSKLRLNTIGSDKWQNNGQWVTWNLKIEESGLYKIAIKGRQNIINGAVSNRTLWINGEIPFAEMKNISFTYDTNWKMTVLGQNDTPYLFYFEPGEYELKLEVTPGGLSQLSQKVNESISALSEIYRNILMITGPAPDKNRDYRFSEQIPDTLLQIKEEKQKFKEYCEEYQKTTGQNGEQAQLLNKIYLQLEAMDSGTEKIPAQFESLEGNISALGSWLITSKQQPLEIDYFIVCAPDYQLPKANGGFWNGLVFQVKSFFASFVTDYNNVGNSSDGSAIKVWIGNGAMTSAGTMASATGRDQSNVLRQIITNDFTKQTGISVNLQLISPGALLPSTLAGKSPDIALSVGSSEPVNYAVRNAVCDLSQFPDYDKISQRFTESALVPMQFNQGVFGLPETQTFFMMYYRKDILNELGLKVPQTWEDVITMLPVLQKKQMSFGMPAPISDVVGVGLPAYAMLLYQNGGTFYNETGSRSNLDSEIAVNSFYDWIKFYNDYGLIQQYDFVNRFRMGSMPIGIADYGVYNQLSVFAPEILGKWEFGLVPGTVKKDGTIDRSVSCNVTASIMMKSSKNKDAAWEFLKWWSDAPAQVKYAQELESVMGTAARYAPANKEALYQIPWTKKQYDMIVKQRQWAKGIPEVPGGYFTSRYLDFTFKQTVTYASLEKLDPGEVLNNAVASINEEINAKRLEFGLPVK